MVWNVNELGDSYVIYLIDEECDEIVGVCVVFVGRRQYILFIEVFVEYCFFVFDSIYVVVL